MVQSLWRTVCRFLKKLKIELPCDPVIPLLGIYPKETKTLTQKDICTPMFIAALFKIAKTGKQPNCTSTNEQIKKMWYLYTKEYDSVIKKKENLPFLTTRMDPESIMQSEISQTNTI